MTTRTKRRAFPVLAALALIPAACGGAASSSNSTTTTHTPSAAAPKVITLKSVQFHPAVIHVSRGGSVIWKWEDADIGAPHNVTSTGATHFASSTTKLTGTYAVTFNAAGTYAFQCTIHPLSMQGKVIVS